MTDHHEELKLWYDKPASEWVEALPVGNGRIGAMVFGGTPAERIQLNEGSLWQGGPHDYDHPGAFDALSEARRLIFAGEYRAAGDLVNEKMMSQPLNQAAYQALGDLNLAFDHRGEVENYRRELDLDSAICNTSYRVGDVEFVREVFVSHPHQILVVRLKASRPGHVAFTCKLESGLSHEVSTVGDRLIMQGISGPHGDITGAVKFAAVAQTVVHGGSSFVGDGALWVRSADEATIFLSLATSYRSYKDVSADALSAAIALLTKAVEAGAEDVQRAHSEDHRRIFRAVSLDLGDGPADQATDKRIHGFHEGHDPALASLYFQYGRYLMIACSRKGGHPATLQGLWNDSLTPPWGSKYTININTEMNYWPAETCGLSECHEPLFEMLHQVAETGAHTARTLYNAKGWVCHHNTDGWRGASPIDGADWGMWPTGGAWLSTHIWQHYLFTGDKSALRRHYPVLKGAAEFFLDTLVEYPGKGWLVTCPSASPENRHPKNAGICAGPTMDMQIVRDLFEACSEAAKVLDVDSELADRMRSTRDKLAPMQIGRAGQLQEWLEDWDLDAPEIHHRHVSHLYGLFPSHQISQFTPKLLEAAKKSLEIRGDAGTGWSLAWKINLWARLHDGEHAYRLVQEALRLQGTGGEGGGVYPNLFDAHPPFQIDGNFGFASGVAEMLIQSDGHTLRLLPALPSAWPTGSVKGLKARGGHTIEVSWKDGRASNVTVVMGWSGAVRVHYGNSHLDLEGTPGHRIRLHPEWLDNA
ncbi:MAG TPA: glycoside hydrolase family 95 protein [Fimbriimonas sp.]|nr:glycoside hydrolase family 95 protein [Fimbriimonas sp.]